MAGSSIANKCDATTQALLGQLARRYNSWARDHALPLWRQYGIDRIRGGFFDCLDPTSLENTIDHKRVRVTARQICVFAQATYYGLMDAGDEVGHGLDHLLGPCRNPEGGYFSKISHDGKVIAAPLDLYDNAFALYALSQAYQLKRESRLLELARAQCTFLRMYMSHPAGGFAESIPSALPRRQNPHMHLLEAALGWLNAIGPEQPFLDLARELLLLFEARFICTETHLIHEFFDDAWQCNVPVGEPGHHFEWIWLISQCQAFVPHLPDTDALNATALCHGRNADNGLLFGSFGPNGSDQQIDVRLWPHTEWLRAETIGDGEYLQQAADAVDRFLDHPRPGLWFERFHVNDGLVLEDVRASSLYHVMGAINAVNQAAAKLEQGQP
ncbi:AGE family epimerase/isomerase [Sphingobium nicotianae]|uniref:AGE family epimerase/isomerase n=1 Tax=Sphingobium nicotianae TaxID=2782607 RepID=A0A9X1DCS3_9SPHN|nr:AGE family epimerase/isomerase [Sphingobium nicotianae]MBT2187509.1 AGE family epimerase/isomerase [Sphingobium nicotianae]